MSTLVYHGHECRRCDGDANLHRWGVRHVLKWWAGFPCRRCTREANR